MNSGMPDIYEEMADMMLTTLAGELAGLSREQFIATFRSKFPVESEFRELVEKTKAQGEMMIAKAQANLPPGHEIAIAIPLNVSPSRPH